jgi:parvulin-like peptidyl-prolyl isomerase
VQQLAKILLPILTLVLAACGGATAADPASENPVTNPTLEATAVSQASVDLVNQQAQPTTAVTPVPATLPTNEAGVPVVARVNDTAITLPEFQRTLARYELQQPDVADAAALQAEVLTTMIEQVLIEQAAAERQIVVTEEQLDAEIQSNIQLAGGEQAWQDWLAENQYTAEEFRETLRDTLITSQVLNEVTADLLNPVPHVHARHILVETDAEAREVLNRLNSGEDFAALAAEYSRDETTARQGGDLGWFTEEELLETSLARTAFSLQPNMVAGPIETLLGYHILQTLERADRPIPPERLPELMQARFENWLDSQVAAATIERYL